MTGIKEKKKYILKFKLEIQLIAKIKKLILLKLPIKAKV